MDLVVQDLACVRGGRRVFAETSFTLHRGEFTVLVGPNGSGKSTLLRAIAGLVPIERGDVRFGDASLRDDRETLQEQIAYVGHLDGVKPALTVRENLRSWARISGAAAGAELERALDETLNRFHLSALEDAPAAQCSAGQKRRLGLSRLVLHPRPLWLLDEPTVALDTAANEALGALIDAHRKTGGVVIAATHAPLSVAPDRELSMNAFAPVGAEEADPFLEDAGDEEVWA
ncbi:MAG: heme ABC exporter ATP-binding protein CcmA [Pseudomonadota bacterium]